MLNFDFLEKSPGLFSPPHIVYDLSRKLTKFHYLIAFILELLDNMRIAIISQVVTSEIFELTFSF